MGLFSSYKDDVTLSVRKDDRPGLYWQRIDDVKVEKAQSGAEYLKIFKTTIRVLDSREGQAQEVGADSTQCIFRGKFSYFERDTKRLAQVAFGLTDDEANELTGKKIESLIKDGSFNGAVMAVSVREQMKSNGEGTFVNCTFKGHVSDEMVEEHVPEETRKALGL